MAGMNLLDWLALLVFALCWGGYSVAVDHVPRIQARSVIAAMDQHRRNWMQAMVMRENRIGDVNIIGNLMNSTSFLANTAIFILGGLMAMLGSPDLGRRVLAAMPFAEVPADAASWEMRIALLVLIFVQAFFELTWALRQFNYCSIVLGSVPPAPVGPEHTQRGETAARVANRAARHFNTGLRAYYFGLAALAWIVHPIAFIAASLWVVQELHRREFRSVVRDALQDSSMGFR